MGVVIFIGTYPLNVSLVPALMNVTEGGNYTFKCQADPPDNVNIIFNVMIDNEDEDKHPRYSMSTPGTVRVYTLAVCYMYATENVL